MARHRRPTYLLALAAAAADGVVPLVRGWRTPDYEALVLAYPAWPDAARGHVVHLQVSRFGFAACRPRRGPPGPPGPPAGA